MRKREPYFIVLKHECELGKWKCQDSTSFQGACVLREKKDESSGYKLVIFNIQGNLNMSETGKSCSRKGELKTQKRVNSLVENDPKVERRKVSRYVRNEKWREKSRKQKGLYKKIFLNSEWNKKQKQNLNYYLRITSSDNYSDQKPN